MSGDRIPGSGTSAIPVYRCETCKDSGVIFAGLTIGIPSFKPCPACDGKSRLAGEVDEPSRPALPCETCGGLPCLEGCSK